jgi:hypothetical protein
MIALQWWAWNPQPYDYETGVLTTTPSQLPSSKVIAKKIIFHICADFDL